MTGTSIADPLIESYMRMADELLDLLTENKELKAENRELKIELTMEAGKRLDGTTASAVSLLTGFSLDELEDLGGFVEKAVAETRITDEDLEAEAAAFELPVWPVPFPNRFPIYNTWQEVPDGVRYESAAEGLMDVWENRDGVRYWVTIAEAEHRSNVNGMNELAPFVEVK